MMFGRWLNTYSFFGHSGIREYQACIQTRIKAKCEDNEVIPEDAEIRRYMFDVPTKYLWTCEDNQYRSEFSFSYIALNLALAIVTVQDSV